MFLLLYDFALIELAKSRHYHVHLVDVRCYWVFFTEDLNKFSFRFLSLKRFEMNRWQAKIFLRHYWTLFSNDVDRLSLTAWMRSLTMIHEVFITQTQAVSQERVIIFLWVIPSDLYIIKLDFFLFNSFSRSHIISHYQQQLKKNRTVRNNRWRRFTYMYMTFSLDFMCSFFTFLYFVSTATSFFLSISTFAAAQMCYHVTLHDSMSLNMFTYFSIARYLSWVCVHDGDTKRGQGEIYDIFGDDSMLFLNFSI